MTWMSSGGTQTWCSGMTCRPTTPAMTLPARWRHYDTGRQAPSYNDDYEYEEELVRSRRSAKGAMVVKGILVAAIIVGIAVAAIYFLNYWNNRPDEGSDLIEMPNLVGQLYEDVAANEQYADFNFIVNEGNDPDKQPGEIMNQNPDPGIMVKQDADVTLLVNGGVEQVAVPDVRDYTMEEAQQAMEDAGLHSQVENVADDEVEEGHVISTDPAIGEMVDQGTTVTLRVSTGPAEEKVTVPTGLEGDLLYNVTATLEDAGLVVGTITQDDSSTLPRILSSASIPARGQRSQKAPPWISPSARAREPRRLSHTACRCPAGMRT